MFFFLAFLLFACCITNYVVQVHSVISHSVSSVVILYPNLLIGIFSRNFKKYDYIWYTLAMHVFKRLSCISFSIRNIND